MKWGKEMKVKFTTYFKTLFAILLELYYSNLSHTIISIKNNLMV